MPHPLKDQTMSTLDSLLGQPLDGKYQIVKQLGQGGMGAVFQAVHLGTQRPVAVKVIAPDFMANTEFVERFKREAVAAGRLRHPNVVNVTDFGFSLVGSTTLAFLVMEFLDGCNLGELLAQKGQLPLNLVVDIVEQTALAIDEAHKQGIVHRDLKPDNIWLEPNRRGGYNIKVLDFGIAKLRDTCSEGSDTDVSLTPSGRLQPVDTEGSTLINRSTLPFSHQRPSTPVFENTEGATQIHPSNPQVSPSPVVVSVAVDSESGTQIHPTTHSTHFDEPEIPRTDGGRATNLLNHGTELSLVTQVGTVMGTPAYMSPEQCKGVATDGKSDIYSLGVIVYQMLAGEQPFKGDTFQLIAKHTEEPPPSLYEKRIEISKDVEAIVFSALAKDPQERPVNARAFAAALRSTIEGETGVLKTARFMFSTCQRHFFALGFIAYLPTIMLAGALIYLEYASGALNSYYGPLAFIGMLVGLYGFALLGNRYNVAAATIIVEKLVTNPESELSFKPIALTYCRNFWPLTKTIFLSCGSVLGRSLPLVVPGIKAAMQQALAPAAVIVEGKIGKDAIERSTDLMKFHRPVGYAFLVRDISAATFGVLYPHLSMVGFLIYGGDDILGDLIQKIFSVWVGLAIAGLFISTMFHSVNCAIPTALFYFQALRSAGIIPCADSCAVEAQITTKPKRPPALKLGTLSWLIMPAVFLMLLAFIGQQNPQRAELIRAVRDGKAAKVKELLKNHQYANATVKNGMSVLSLSANNGHTEIVQTLLEAGANPNARDNDGDTPLMMASRTGYAETVQALLKRGAAINEQNKNKETALWLAARLGRSEVVKVLIAANANPTLRDKTGKTPLEKAQEENRAEVVQLLTKQ
ncbi:MAG TPA: protein kinase [Acidobacteriota bacterium]|nr:protein kinase [Acidobacteriota bacterium]